MLLIPQRWGLPIPEAVAPRTSALKKSLSRRKLLSMRIGVVGGQDMRRFQRHPEAAF